MAEASWAAAGMLAARDGDHPAQLAELAVLSERLYGDYLHRVEELSGLTVPLRTRAALVAGRSTGRRLSGQEAQNLVPGLEIERRSFAWMDEASLDPRDLCAALPRAAAAAGVDLQPGTEVLAASSRAGSVEVSTSRGTVSASAFVNCCGAWAAGVEPCKGQMLAVLLPLPVDLKFVLRSPEVYLVPRGSGLVAIGATVERVGFDRRVEPEALQRLQAQAAELWPPVADATIVDSWTGLRPGTEDGLPLIGRAEQANCWTATGHFRNGILLAPATALVMRQLLQGDAPEVSLAAFAPGRLSLSDKVPSAAL